jgi:hypothetical protein
MVTITRQQLPAICAVKFPDGWSPRCTKYLFKESEMKKIRANTDFESASGETIQIGGFRLKHIGSLGPYQNGDWFRIVEVSQPENGEPFPDFLGELCEDPTGPLGDRAGAELREKFDALRCQFNEFGLFGERPVLYGVKSRKEQRRTINEFARRLFPKDRAGAKMLAEMLVDSIDNMEPAVELE